jgi:hypothetical protein
LWQVGNQAPHTWLPMLELQEFTNVPIPSPYTTATNVAQITTTAPR